MNKILCKLFGHKYIYGTDLGGKNDDIVICRYCKR